MEHFDLPDEMKEWVTKHEVPEVAPPAPGPPVTSSPWDSVEAPLPPPSPREKANVTHPLPSGVELERLDLPFSTSDILAGYEDDVIVRNDSFTLWTRIKMEELLALHMVDAKKSFSRISRGRREEARYFSADAPI